MLKKEVLALLKIMLPTDNIWFKDVPVIKKDVTGKRTHEIIIRFRQEEKDGR